MSKPPKNPNIGTVVCRWRGCKLLAAVRRNAGGRLYTDCLNHGVQGGVIQLNQEDLLAEADMWGHSGPPPDTPRWIAEQWPTSRARALPAEALASVSRDTPASPGVARSPAPGESRDAPASAALPDPPAPSENSEPAVPHPPGNDDGFWD